MDITAAGAFIERYGLPMFMFLAFGYAIMSGKLRTEREVNRERQISDGKDVLISTLTDEIKASTVVNGRLADSFEERNRIEKDLRGRRT